MIFCEIFRRTVCRNAPLLLMVLIGLAALAGASSAQTGGVKGKVRSARGTGIPNAEVTVRSGGKDLRSTRSDSKGNFVISGLDTGRYNLVFDAPGYGSGVLYNVEVKPNTVRDLGERLMLMQDLGSLVLIRGSVFYREGTSLAGANVEIARVSSDGSLKRLTTAFTNESGEFTFRRPPGDAKYRVTAKFKDATGSKEIDVTNAAIYRLAITLDVPQPK